MPHRRTRFCETHCTACVPLAPKEGAITRLHLGQLHSRGFCFYKLLIIDYAACLFKTCTISSSPPSASKARFLRPKAAIWPLTPTPPIYSHSQCAAVTFSVSRTDGTHGALCR